MRNLESGIWKYTLRTFRNFATIQNFHFIHIFHISRIAVHMSAGKDENGK